MFLMYRFKHQNQTSCLLFSKNHFLMFLVFVKIGSKNWQKSKIQSCITEFFKNNKNESMSNPQLHNTFIRSLDHFISPAGGGWAIFVGIGGACASLTIRAKLLSSTTGAHSIFSGFRRVGADSRRIATAIINCAWFNYKLNMKTLIFKKHSVGK